MKRFVLSDSERKLGVEYVRASKHSVQVLREAAKMLFLGDKDLAGLPHAYSTSAKRHGQAMLEALDVGVKPRKVKRSERAPAQERSGRGRMSHAPGSGRAAERAAVPERASDRAHVPGMPRNRLEHRVRPGR
jgi:hypothetical protein